MADLSAVVKKRYWGESVRLLRKTTPFLLLNLVVYAAFFLAVVVWLGIFGGLAVFFAPRLEVVAWVMLLVAVVVPGGVLAFARRYVLYLVKGAHIAVVTKLLLEGDTPEGTGQVAYGREVVRRNFRDVSVLFAVDRLVDGTLRGFSNSFVRLVDVLPLGGQLTQVARIITQIVRRSLSYVDEAILSYAIARDEPNAWRSARHGIILYAQAYKPILGTAVRVWLVGRVVFVGALVLFAVPGLALLSVFDAVAFQVVVVAATLLLAYLTVLAAFEPFAVIYTMVTYHGAIEGLTPDPVWDQRLQKVSEEFRELIGKARESAVPDAAADPLDTAPPAVAAPVGQGDVPAPATPAASASRAGPDGNGAPDLGRVTGLSGLLGKAAEQLMSQPGPVPPAAPTGFRVADRADPAVADPAADDGREG